MSQFPDRPPSILPEEDTKRQTRPIPQMQNHRRGYIISLLLTVILLSIAFFSVASIILYRPGVFDLETRSNVAQTEIKMQGTREALQSTAESLREIEDALIATAQANSDAAFNNQSTQAALENRQLALDQAETQAVLDAQATQTAVAIANAQQATQVALDFQATQVEFERAATQAEIAYQGTQAALNRDATAAALGFANNAPAGNDILTQTPPPTMDAMPLFSDGFDAGLNTVTWDFSAIEDWSLDADGNMIANRSGAWLLSQTDSFADYRIDAELVPLQGDENAADYLVLLNVQTQSPNGYALRISYNGSKVTAASLHSFSLTDLFSGEGLLNRELATLQSRQINPLADSRIRLRVEVRDGRIVAVVNEHLAIDLTLPESPAPGAVGLQLPQGAGIVQITALP